MRKNKSKGAYLRPEDVGHWQGEDFVFNEPMMIGGRPMARLVTKGMRLEPGITRDDVIHALINPQAMNRLEQE